jgi:hypothetical protein
VLDGQLVGLPRAIVGDGERVLRHGGSSIRLTGSGCVRGVRYPEAGLDEKDFTTAIPREFDYLSKLTREAGCFDEL